MVPDISQIACDDLDWVPLLLIQKFLGMAQLARYCNIGGNISTIEQQKLEPFEGILVGRNRVSPGCAFVVIVEQLGWSFLNI